VTADRVPRRRRRKPRGVALRQLRQRCKNKLQDLQLELPAPFTIERFCELLGQRLSRQIVLCPVDTRTGPCGLWVATPTTDYFLYESATTPLHREQILLHEAGHRAFNHHSAEVMHDELAKLLGLDVELIRHVLGRTTYSDTEEQEAEVFGTFVLEQAVRAVIPAPQPADPEVAAVLHRVQTALTGSDSAPDER
jgi:hypothetical protein